MALVCDVTKDMSEYELQRMKNLEENRRILESIRQEQLCSLEHLLPPKKTLTERRQTKKKRSEDVKNEGEEGLDGNYTGDRKRKSARLDGKDPLFTLRQDYDVENSMEEYSDDDEELGGSRKRKRPTGDRSRPRVLIPKNRPNYYGAVPGVEVGRIWETRMECSADGIQRPPVAGIHGGPEGAYSISLSGGYEDDVDWGHCFTYTGEGGRALKGTKAKPKNLRTAPQSRDQTLTRGNLALSLNITTRKPVRVIRGYNLNNSFAPEYGYRYDGLYTVEKYWSCIGKSGFKVFKFALRRYTDQAPAPWVPQDPSIKPTDANKSSKEQNNDSEDEENVPCNVLQVKLFKK